MKRILFAIPIPFGPRWSFWVRDSGLVVLALREMGFDAWLVALGDSTTVTEGQPVLPISIEEMRSAAWWKAQQPDAVVLNTWSAFRYDAIRKAALAATPRVVERLDTDGIRSARLFPRPYFVRAWGGYWDRFQTPFHWLAIPCAFARFIVCYLFPSRLDSRMVATMRRLPGLIAESPIAAERIQRMIERVSGSRHRMEVIPHPVNEDVIRYTGAAKENRIITVGRWASAQKDFPLLRRVLKSFLQSHPDWTATVVGSGVPAEQRPSREGAEEWEQRMTYHENLTHEELVVEYNRSKIYLMGSRYESFCIAAAEALCCGCSVVGSCEIPSSYYFAELESGQLAAPRTRESFLETLDREVECWVGGKRNPQAIASSWNARAGSRAVARATLAFLEKVLP
jgi:glycosyltransferase involved in cell wall biosynthesis